MRTAICDLPVRRPDGDAETSPTTTRGRDTATSRATTTASDRAADALVTARAATVADDGSLRCERTNDGQGRGGAERGPMKRMGDEGRVALHGARLLMNTRGACCASALGGRRQAAPDEREVMHGERRGGAPGTAIDAQIMMQSGRERRRAEGPGPTRGISDAEKRGPLRATNNARAPRGHPTRARRDRTARGAKKLRQQARDDSERRRRHRSETKLTTDEPRDRRDRRVGPSRRTARLDDDRPTRPPAVVSAGGATEPTRPSEGGGR